MFTGIIQGKGRIAERRVAGGGHVLTIESGFDLTDPEEGESIAINGVCLTAKDITGRRFTVDVSPETLNRTTLGGFVIGRQVNLERALRLSDRLGGHLVSGHVDCVSRVLDRRSEGDYVRFVISIPEELHHYLIEKGSVAVDGVSLTVNACDKKSFALAIIPHTLAVTTLGDLGTGEAVNIEVDIIGKYVEKLLSVRPDAEKAATINPAFLAEHGFLK